jgi:DNA-directed RNA polymerase specialized sigma24 family protein
VVFFLFSASPHKKGKAKKRDGKGKILFSIPTLCLQVLLREARRGRAAPERMGVPVMERRTRADRLARRYPPAYFDAVENASGAWYESESEIRRGLDAGTQRKILLRWVRRNMKTRLTDRERHCIELYYFQGLSCREAAAATDTCGSSVWRALQRALRKLRAAKEKDTSWRAAFPERDARR